MCADVLLLNLLTPSEVCLFNVMLCIDIYYKGFIHPHPFAFNFIIFNIRFMDLVLIGFEKDFHINIQLFSFLRIYSQLNSRTFLSLYLRASCFSACGFLS